MIGIRHRSTCKRGVKRHVLPDANALNVINV